MITGVLFYVFAAVLIVAALGVITTRNPVHSALFLVLAFVQSAVLWLLIEAEFLAITIESDVGADGTRRTTRYDIDLFKCIYCGFCEEACPVDAIVETRIHEYHMERKGENIMTKDKLLAVGDKYEAMIAADKAADAAFR